MKAGINIDIHVSPKPPHVIKPYAHDCQSCVWVGWIHVQGGGKFGSSWGNMYFCPPDAVMSSPQGSVLIRFSDEPSDYWSSPVGACVKGSLEVN